MRKCVTIALVCAALVCAATNSQAQDAYGTGAVGTGNITPVLSCNQAYMGNAQFALTVSKGRGGSSGWLGVSSAPGSLFVGTTEILVGLPPSLVALFPVSLNGTSGAPGAGSATLNFPMNFGPIPALAGLSYYAQYVGNDYPTPGNPSASRGLRVEITMPPSVFVGLSVGGSTDRHYFVDPTNATLQTQSNTSFTDNVTDAVWTGGGRNLFVGSSIRNQVNWADVTTFPPVWQTIYQASAGGCYGMGFDRANQRLYTFTDPGLTAGREFVALDGDPNSSTFGQLLANSTNLFATNFVERWSISPSGKLACFIAPLFAPFNLEIIDIDPASPSYMKIIRSAPVPVTGVFPIGTRVRFTNEEDAILLLIQIAGSTPGELARYDIAGNTFIDYNASQPGTQHIGVNSNPPALLGSAPTDIEMSPDGTFAVISGFNNPGWAGRLDLQPGNAGAFAYTTLRSNAPGAWACGLSRDGQLMSVGSWSPPQLFLLDPQTGASKGTVPLSGASNIYTIKHR